MKLFGFQTYTPPETLKKNIWLLFVKSPSGNGFSIFLPWMVHGKYYPQCSNLFKFGWRCLRVNVIFFMKFRDRVTDLVKFIPFMEEI